MKKAFEIGSTNWITVVTYYLGFVLYGIVNGIVNFDNESTIFYTIFGPFLATIVYFWFVFLLIPIAVLIIDIILFFFNQDQKYTIYKLAFIAIIYIGLLFYGSIDNDGDLGLGLVILLSFPLAQALRYNRIQKILAE